MSDRISAFEKYMRDEFKRDPGKTTIKSKKQWMYEYKKWIMKDDTVEKEILKYLTEGE